MAKIISDNLAYAKCIQKMTYRTEAANTDFSSLLPEELEEALKAAATISMGTEISVTDLTNIMMLADQVISITAYRTELFEYLRNRMAAIAPNLTALLGELVGARLIAHSGSLMNLAKAPASTIQILGAEKALFRALKTKHDTPKYGLIFHASLVGAAPNQLKGKMARMVAGKTALAVRFDALADADTRSDPDAASIGVSGRSKLEARLRQLEAGLGIQSVRRAPGQGAQQNKFTYGANGTAYNPATDVLIPTQTQASTSKQPLIEVVDEEGAAAAKKDKKVRPRLGLVSLAECDVQKKRKSEAMDVDQSAVLGTDEVNGDEDDAVRFLSPCSSVPHAYDQARKKRKRLKKEAKKALKAATDGGSAAAPSDVPTEEAPGSSKKSKKRKADEAGGLAVENGDKKSKKKRKSNVDEA
jgi:nucleolar protein 58